MQKFAILGAKGDPDDRSAGRAVAVCAQKTAEYSIEFSTPCAPQAGAADFKGSALPADPSKYEKKKKKR